jgi:hypothetical protein
VEKGIVILLLNSNSMYLYLFFFFCIYSIPLGTYWKNRDKEGYILNWDGSRSPVVHQWDRWEKELQPFVDRIHD